MNKYIFLPNKKEKIEQFENVILPLEKFSIGFDAYFSVSEINEKSKTQNVFVMINKFMHKNDIVNIENIIKDFDLNSIKGFFIEDLGLCEFFPKEKVIIYQNHLIDNYYSINYLNSLDFKNVVVNNELTIEELKTIRANTKIKLYYFLISKNMLMYSARTLIKNYFLNYDLKQDSNKYIIEEELSKNKLIVKEEDDSTTISSNKIFAGNKYLDKLNEYDYLIINLSNISSEEEKIILDNYDNKELYTMLDSDYYFLENEIDYKVGDLK